MIGFYSFNKEKSYYNSSYIFEEGVNNDYSKNVTLYFYDNNTHCPVDGKIYSGKQFIGEVLNGNFILNETSLDKINQNEDFTIQGHTNSCFGLNENFPYYRSWTWNGWTSINDLNPIEEFNLDLDPPRPKYPQEMQGFIQPEEVKQKLENIHFENKEDLLERMEKILRTTNRDYISDKSQFGEEEYWQTPGLFLKTKIGDCEDWAIYSLSLLKAYNSSLECYAANWLTHMNIICKLDKQFVIFDQDNVEKIVKLNPDLIEQDNKILINKWINGYFEEYGIPINERQLYYLFNEKEFISFNDWRKEFIPWMFNKTNMFSKT